MAVRQKAKNNWIADFYIDGKRKQKSGFKTKKLAQAYIDRRKGSNDNDSAMIARFEKMRFVEIAQLYRDNHLSKAGEGTARNVSYINGLIKRWGEYKINAIPTPEVKLWVKEMVADGKAIATVEKYVNYFKTCFNYAIEEEEIIKTNPIAHIKFTKLFKMKNVRNVTLSQEEYLEFRNLFLNGQWYLLPIIEMLWYTGMRISEVLNLKWEKVHLQRGVIILPPANVKERKYRTIGLEPELIRWLQSIKELRKSKSPYVFGVTQDKPMTYKTYYDNYRKIVDSTKWSGVNIHDQRHCYTKRKDQEGHRRSAIMINQGHSSESMFHRYNDTDEEEVLALAGFDLKHRAIIDHLVSELVDVMKKEGIALNTLYASVRDVW